MPSPAERLTEALATLTRLDSRDDRIPTVTELCRLAAISRNSLYRYHPDTLKALHEYRLRRRAQLATEASSESRQLKAELRNVKEQIPKFVALIDHYYLAYHETRAMLDHRERELAELRRRLEPKERVNR